MSFTIKTTTNPDLPASFITNSILNQLDQGKHILFFLSGGSCIAIGLKVAEILKDHDIKNLTIALMDERYGPLGHADSNWQQLIEKGFNISGAKLIPVLIGNDILTTTENFNAILGQELKAAEYKIGLFGIGTDGHTAGILPESEAVKATDLAYGYKTEKFERITVTFKTIEKLDEAVVWMQGEEKWKVLESLEKEIDVIEQPAQILKKVPLLTIFTDYKKSGHKINQDRK